MSALDPRAIAAQGVGFSPRVLAAQGLWPVGSPLIGLPARRRDRRDAVRDDDELLLLLSAMVASGQIH